MKKMIMIMMAAAMAVVAAAADKAEPMPRSEWHNLVSECAQNPDKLKETIAKLSSSDKKDFLAEINEAISKLPGSEEVKAAKFLAANRAAISGAGAADRLTVLAEVYATVPPESLTIINEEFAKDFFARPDTMSDKEFNEIVATSMEVIAARCATAESGGVRAGFAALMFIRADGDKANEELTDIIIEKLPTEVHDVAKNSWFPAALGINGQQKTYDPMLGAAQAGAEPIHPVVTKIAGIQLQEMLLGELRAMDAGLGREERGTTHSHFDAQSAEMSPAVKVVEGTKPHPADGGLNGDIGGTSVPRARILDPDSPWYNPSRGNEPGGYKHQTTRAW